MSFAVGSLVRVRGREWVVLPSEDEEMLMVRPLGGTDDEITGIYLPLEPVEPAQFELPDPESRGDYRSCRLLRDAVRLGFRSSAGPFRSFAYIAVEPRPYQFVPLLMALKLDPVRLLIADDVGIGKTIEAGLIARELIDRGEVKRLAVLCPPQLAEQWKTELAEKFHIEAELVLSSTAAQLERRCRSGESLFERFPYVIVSTDFIKADRRRNDFVHYAPELIIVDEAHTCAYAGERRSSSHQRYQLVASLAEEKNRHLILVTATPHSGKEEAFRSLLAFLNEDFKYLPEDLTGPRNAPIRERVADHFIQRRRADIVSYLDTDTSFPKRDPVEDSYLLSKEYKQLIERVLNYARETVLDESTGQARRRVLWWAALALLRSVTSSPAAAVAALRGRAAVAEATSEDEVELVGRQTVLDLMDTDASESIDLTPGGDTELTQEEDRRRRRLQAMAREAETLTGAKDAKLQKALQIIADMVKENFQPIVFCRFIHTAHYVARALRQRLPKVAVEVVTGEIPPLDREERIQQLAEQPQRILVCTDCLSEGVNLQDHFDAVFHYDLSWNPTRHEQRDGRVDRYGQPKKLVRIVTYYGKDNQIDGLVLNVLINKHNRIRNSLGISVPVPFDNEAVIEAIFEGLVLRENTAGSAISGKSMVRQHGLWENEEGGDPLDELFKLWDTNAERENRSRTIFAQQSIKGEVVAAEVAAIRSAIGSKVEVETFVREALTAHGAFISEKGGALHCDLSETPRALRDAMGLHRFGQTAIPRIKARFELPVQESEVYLNRTHSLVEGLASYVMDAALDTQQGAYEKRVARRCGVISTDQVSLRTTLILVRHRFHIITLRRSEEYPLLAEDCQVLAFTGAPHNAQWLTDQEEIERLLTAASEANISAARASYFLHSVLDEFDLLRPHLAEVAHRRAQEVLLAHRRVREAAHARGIRYRIKEQAPDILGVYVYLPRL
ncbi:MAG TPA: helicase-related protein [Ktedonobacteraceae bacterium]|nr:helicase-related protein [Ktedonobacteraceae bacterium]